MNILQINTVDKQGGAAKVAWLLKEGLEKEGCRTSMFVKLKYSAEPSVFTAERWQNSLSRALRVLTDKNIGSAFLNKLRPFLANDLDFFGTSRLLQTPEFKAADIVHCHNLHGNYFSISALEKISRVKPVVWTLHDMWAMTPRCAHTRGAARNGFFDCPSLKAYQEMLWHNEPYLRSRKRAVYAAADFTLVTPCRWLSEKVAESVLKDKPLRIIPNGINTAVFKKEDKTAAREKLRLPSDKKIVLFVSPVGPHPEKGWDYAETVMKLSENRDDILFLSVGTRKETDRGDSARVRSVGFISNEKELARYYSAADVFLFTSKAETFPLVILEAMACGLPVASFDVGGVGEAVVHKETGYIAKYLDAADIKRGVDWLLSQSPAEYEKMSLKAIGRVRENFTAERMVKNYLELYREILANPYQHTKQY